MRRVCTLIFIGCISFSGFATLAQPPGGRFMDSFFDSMVPGGGSTGAPTGNTVGDIMEQMVDTSVPIGQQTSAIEEELLVVDAPTSEANQTALQAIDTKTKRYLPRLKINFSEFPLRSLSSTDGRGVNSKTQTDIIALRVQNRLRVSHIDLVVHNRIATVSGTVATERQRGLAESMLRFEPGIDGVQNKITVAP